MASLTAAILRGAGIIRVHDVKAAVESVTVADAIRQRSANV
jgi:dihydropteroate synthase